MFKKSFPLLLLLASAVAFAGCSSSNPLLGEAQSSIKKQDYAGAQTAAEKYIQQFPQKPLGYYYKGVALGEKASKDKSPDQSTSDYKAMADAFSKSQQMAANEDKKPDEIKRIPAVKSSYWRQEHNKGVAYVNNDSLKGTTDKPLDLSVAHLKNATIIEPDSSLSWNVLALVQNKREDYGDAAAAQKKYISLSDSVSAKDYLLLSQFYRLGDKNQEAINTLENARQKYSKNTKMIEILADSYSNNGQSEKAINMVKELVQNDPSNPQYHLSLGTQIYQAALKIQGTYSKNVNKIYDLQSKLRKAQGADKDKIQQQISNIQQKNTQLEQKMDDLTNRAVKQLNSTLQYRSDDKVAYSTLGIVYRNKAAVLFDKRNLATTDNEKAAKYDKQAKAELRKSMQNYQKAVQIDPNNKEYWKSLFQIYTTLGMDKKAAEAEKKAGMK